MNDQTTPTLWDRFAYKTLITMAKSKMAFEVRTANAYTPAAGMPIIFAVNHSNCYDVPNSTCAAGRHLLLIAGKQRLAMIDALFFRLNGVIYVDRLNKSGAEKAKAKIMRALKGKTPILWFPEGTWNLTDNLLMLPMKWGIVDIAAKAGAQIIPTVLDYDRDTMICTARFGSPIYGKALFGKAEAIRTLRDSMAALRYESLESKPVVSRDGVDLEKLKNDIVMAIEEYPPLEPEKEAAVVFRPYKKVDTLPGSLIPSKDNAFLFNKRLQG